MYKDDFLDYVIEKHGNKQNTLEDIIKKAECPECGSNHLFPGIDNEAITIDSEHFYYARDFICEECHCKFKFRVSNILDVVKISAIKYIIIAISFCLLFVSLAFVLSLFVDNMFPSIFITCLSIFPIAYCCNAYNEAKPTYLTYITDDELIDYDYVRSDI